MNKTDPKALESRTSEPMRNSWNCLFVSKSARTTTRVSRKLGKRFLASESGIASVEFGLFFTILLVLCTGSFDIVYMISARRDADRASMLATRVLVTCPNTTCILDTMDKYYKRRANVLWRYPEAEVGISMIERISGAIILCSGTGKTLDADVKATAMNLFRDDDVGAAVTIKAPYTSIMPKELFGPNGVLKYMSTTGKVSYRAYTVDVFANNGKVC